ncbi:PAS domain S-box protein [Halotia branconii]|uniref:histidine kinase n=1 Tax=Halotia branconii CENA392 TaxID=1539056 RepID=A0AAJ6NY93_9CYAN|nr:PAS domain S-box protein [Halotia branconii]WGV28608.1 PAS domain S-box protein [Halotia branconii CENA392]
MDETVNSLDKPDFPSETMTMLEKIAANLPGMIFQFVQQQDGCWKVLYISSGCQALYELEPEAIQTDFQILCELIHPQDLTVFTESIEVATATLIPWSWEGRIITPSGKLKWLQGSAQLQRQANGDILWDGLVIDITNRKQTEEQLRASEARYQAILTAIPDLMFRISRDGEYLDLKGEAANLYSIKEEIIGRNMWDILPNDVAAIGQEAIAKTLDSQTLQTCEYHLPTPSGIRDYEARLVVSGQNEVLAIVRDITQRKQAEVTLRNLAQKFSKAFNCSPDPITISTLETGRFIEVNDSFVRLSGYERDEVIGRKVFELDIWINPSDRTELLQQLQTNKVVRNWECEFRQKSGEIITALLSAEIIDLDDIPCILAVHHDITERKQVEAQLHLSAQRDRLLTETLVRIRSSLNLEQILQTTVTEVRQFLQADRVFIGLHHIHTAAKAIAESVNPEYPSVLDWKTEDKTYLQELKKLLTTNRVRVVEDVSQVTVPTKLQAHYQQFHTKATLAVPIMLGDELLGALVAHQCSNPRHWQSIEIDLVQQMSEQLAIAIQQVRLYEELAQLNTNLEYQVEERTAQLQQKMQELAEMQRVKDVVLHTVAHDLRTSVVGNLMVLQNLLKNQGLAPESASCLIPVSRSILERMIQGNDRQLTMIDSLLEIHCCKNQGVVLNREMLRFSTVLGTVIPELQPMLHQNQATLKNLVPQDLPLVIADKTRLQRVLKNLLTYSLQHNPPGLNFTVKAAVTNKMVRVQMQNDGVAMNKLESDRLFDLYVPEPQASCSTDIGLKMYLCRQIIQAHGGEIGVISNTRRGLTFWFTLPLATS